MDTTLAPFIRDTDSGRAAKAILRKCVHCGFCTATCPTYQLLGDELDSPRGRIYLMKQMLEGAEVTERTQTHLDRCLTCRSCETTCPSGVEYGRLLEIGREIVDTKVKRSLFDRLLRRLLSSIVPYPRRFSILLRLGQLVRPVLPHSLRNKVPEIQAADGPWPPARHQRKMLMLNGCAQSVTAPGINLATARLLDYQGISLLPSANTVCCGALDLHMSDKDRARQFARANIDAWWPEVENGAEAIVITASGCASVLADYAELLQADPVYAPRAERVSALIKDASQVLDAARLPALAVSPSVAFHSPCTLQHHLGIRGRVEALLRAAGFTLTRVADSHLCCGSAGSYSITQPAIANALRERKIASLQKGNPEFIATANIGCLMHLSGEASVPVKHWVELLASTLPKS